MKPYNSRQKWENFEPVCYQIFFTVKTVRTRLIWNLVTPGKSLDNVGGGRVGAILEIAGAPSIFVHLDKGYTWMLTWMHILKPFGFARKPGCPWRGRHPGWAWRWRCRWGGATASVGPPSLVCLPLGSNPGRSLPDSAFERWLINWSFQQFPMLGEQMLLKHVTTLFKEGRSQITDNWTHWEIGDWLIVEQTICLTLFQIEKPWSIGCSASPPRHLSRNPENLFIHWGLDLERDLYIILHIPWK